MLQNELATVQKRIQETCHINERSLFDLMATKCSLLSQKAYFRHVNSHWIITIAETSRKVVINYDYLQSKEISNSTALA